MSKLHQPTGLDSCVFKSYYIPLPALSERKWPEAHLILKILQEWPDKAFVHEDNYCATEHGGVVGGNIPFPNQNPTVWTT